MAAGLGLAASGCATGISREKKQAKAAPDGAGTPPPRFVLDAHTHHVDADPDAVWPKNNKFYAALFERISKERGCDEAGSADGPFDCLSRDEYIRELFVRSETDVALLVGVPSLLGKNPLTNDQLLATRRRVNGLAHGVRCLAAPVVHPNVGKGELRLMADLPASEVAAWAVYTGWAPDGGGWFLDDAAIAEPFFDQVKASGKRIVLAHKGLPWPNFDPVHASPRDVGPSAKAHPDLNFVVVHAGVEADQPEGPYDPYRSPATADVGANRLLKSLEQAGIWPNQNVYVDLSGAWALVMNKPDQAAHLVGKLLKYVGTDRVLWATDSLWSVAPRRQLEAFHAFAIPDELQEKFGYPALTPEVKAKVLGLNGAALFGVDPRAPRGAIDPGQIG